MFAFSGPILLMGVRTRDVMGDANTLEEGCKLLVLLSPVCLNCKDLLIKQTFNKLLEFMKFMKHIRFTFEKIKPRKLAIIINERHIIFKFPNRDEGKAPNI
jgi:hypothetical protein